MESIRDIIKKQKKRQELVKFDEETKRLQKQIQSVKKGNEKIQDEIITEMKNKWEKIHNTSDYKRFVYLVKEERTFRGKNKELDEWVKKTFS